ncbi:regulatory protein, FmdB family [Thermodesulfatator indicus DSM 15286]|uniref:Regulatory protein, FmdB family n=1 Tax=Thermodesulfatator indicus (strain DSM 15286 / JCM 11887 / CIR29812) TaxID=667014 RepID=F8AA26_THEID|nr:zinc ribbon domain-containing protein [Thermodesulfatator indicus]AEH45312.1 regulatory protein, FmdB family [Thermodesulfatator indicus DSM 15286]
MPIYEFRCEICGHVFERILKMNDPWPPCPACGEKKVLKLPSVFGFTDASSWRSERERAILKRARDYLVDGKVKEAQRFLSKAQQYVKTERIAKLSDVLANRKSVKGGYISRTELMVTKEKGG